MRRRRRAAWRRCGLALGLVASCPVATEAGPAEEVADSRPLTRLSLEELAGLKVVSVSRRAEANLEAPGAVHVVTAEDIRRTAAFTVPDALRTAPGVQTSRIDADEWALAIRGFASRLSRSVLVVVDGRSVWTPLFAGVFWDANDTLLEDVEQIEISRGPGGAVYGANALNGVIAVTTRQAQDTQGGLLTAAGGTEDWQAGLRWGGRQGTNLHYRVFGKYADRDGTEPTTPSGYDDRWRHALGGLRVDWNRSPRDGFTFLADLYNGSSGQPTAVAVFTPPFTQLLAGDAAFRGRNALGRWRRALGAGELVVQSYFDHTTRHEPHYSERRNTLDFDAQHRLGPRGRHDLLWGASYRRSRGEFQGVPSLQIVPSQRTDDIAGLFANDELRLAGDRLRVSIGTKLEWNDYSGWNVQPSGRVAWRAAQRHTLWGSVTRGVRTSSRVERDVVLYSSLNATQPLFARVNGSPDFEPESVLALEAGYKLRVPRVIVTASVFRNAYRDLATNLPGAPFVEAGSGAEPPRLVVPVRIANGLEGTATGAEARVIVDALKSWRLQATYSLLKLEVDGQTETGFGANSPRHQLWLTSYWSPVEPLDVDLVFRAVGDIPGHQVPGFQDVDLRVAYRPRPTLELAAVGANLLDARRPEFGGGFEVERSGRLQATLRF